MIRDNGLMSAQSFEHTKHSNRPTLVLGLVGANTAAKRTVLLSRVPEMALRDCQEVTAQRLPLTTSIRISRCVITISHLKVTLAISNCS